MTSELDSHFRASRVSKENEGLGEKDLFVHPATLFFFLFLFFFFFFLALINLIFC